MPSLSLILPLLLLQASVEDLYFQEVLLWHHFRATKVADCAEQLLPRALWLTYKPDNPMGQAQF